MDAQIFKFFKLNERIMRTKYRQQVQLVNTDLKNDQIAENVLSGIFPHRVSSDYDQIVQVIKLVDCGLSDASISNLFSILMNSSQNYLY